MNELNIREAVFEDSNEIVSLLRNTLGESLLPKSVQYWKWKHYDNPFGISKILVAVHHEHIIGVRAFLKWKWQNSSSTVTSIRAVDTATLPQFQSRGVFKKLTLLALEQCKSEGIDMVFNTPNKVSMPGYIKMGWKGIGKMPIQIYPCFNLPTKYNEDDCDLIYMDHSVDSFLLKVPDCIDFSNSIDTYNTAFTLNYFKWRYADCPIINYGVKGCVEKYFFFFRIKKIGRFIELRICDFWMNTGIEFEQQFMEELTQLVYRIRPLFVSIAPDRKLMKKKGFWFDTKTGPMTTIRTLSMNDLNDFNLFKNWNPSIGSMELF
jgi:GNAT superfamily N-acetyltransferase